MATRYQLLLCDISGKHEFIAVFESNSPFPCVAVGQRFDDHGWVDYAVWVLLPLKKNQFATPYTPLKQRFLSRMGS